MQSGILHYGNMGCQISKVGIQNWVDFFKLLKRHYCILWIDIAPSQQKLDTILGNEVKKKFGKKCAYKLIFLNEKKN